MKPTLALAFTLLFFLTGLGGCTAYRVLQIEPVGKKGAIIAPKFDQSYYYYDRDQTLHFVMRSTTTDRATGKKVDQVATVRVFWRPIGGKTTMDNSAVNATYRYVLMTPDTVGMYEGSGFVRLWGKHGVKKLSARLMDGDLRLTQASKNFIDNLGRARIRGNFTARYDDALALEMLMNAHREFFARSLLKPPNPAATQPGERDQGVPAAEPTSLPGAVISPPTIGPATGVETQPATMP